MKHFINPATNEVFAYEVDGSQDHLIDPTFTAVSPEQLEAIRAASVTAPVRAARELIALELSVTPRKIREAILTGDHSFIKAVDSQIAALRGQL